MVMLQNSVTIDRSQQLDKLRTDISTATTSAQQAGVAMADVVLAMLQRADELCELAEDIGDDMSKLSAAFGGDDV
jgi:hypothetical protein